ncbi:hypothetical protein C900_01481 [Fulvivirga imtechensis AK7]|uniref:Lipid/polyisoprenoid-binding YceI-like domain-containing protein n=1 Tax=Fulvivirga imtechensis AK7 TaxID=1237149 RepID=L8JTZ6_9BACT|nr:YceI family protein [Fulvivirga imtechensis]ELR72486.1 hypothetical protein C900_01481 [Fulvivirga imtechensis AK7]
MSAISVIFLLSSLLGSPKADPCLIIQEKSITINGNTSLGGFSCDYEVAGKGDTLHINTLHISPYSFTIPVEAFECGNFILNRDFQSTLKAKTHPKVTVEVLSLEEKEPGTMKGNIRLSLVGKSKTLENIEFCMKLDKTRQVLSADFVFYASEFKLTPPRKLGGLIKAEDAMDITVSLVLKPA